MSNQTRLEILSEIREVLKDSILGAMVWRWRSWDEIRSMSWFTMSSYTTFFLIVASIIFALLQAGYRARQATKPDHKRNILPAPDFPSVEPLTDFKWETTEPVKHRPFKPKYHLTMADETALENLDPSELIVMDKNYASRIEHRQRMLQEHHDIVVNVNDDTRIRPAVEELYRFLMGTYLPTRYPNMFRVHATLFETGRALMLENVVTRALYPAEPSKLQNTVRLLETLGRTLDEDFLLLLPEEGEKDPKYVLEAYMTVCASGFSPKEKLGKRLADIHEPVPGYAQKLEGSMDRFFSKVETGKYVKRVNWTVTTHGELYAAEGSSKTHAAADEEVEEMEEIDVENTFVRVERQTLHRLPKSKALVFAFKTYLYPIKQIKDEGLGEELAEAIDGLKAGSVPQMHFYKRGVVWGEAVKRYLRS